MRTQDRTYLQQLGFDDSDRKNVSHNGCCLYLKQPEKILKLLNLFEIEDYVSPWGNWRPYAPEKPLLYGEYSKKIEAKLEERLRKFKKIHDISSSINSQIVQASHNFMRIIGYADLKIKANYSDATQAERRCINISEIDAHMSPAASWEKQNWEKFKNEELRIHSYGTNNLSLIVEVKHGFTDVTTVIQQINTYKTFAGYAETAYIVCTMYKVNALYINTLREHGINHIYVPESAVTSFLASQSKVESEEF